MQCYFRVYPVHWQTAVVITGWCLTAPCWSHEAVHTILFAYHVGSPIYRSLRSVGDKYRAHLLTRCGVFLLLRSSKFRCLPRGWVPGQQRSSQYCQWRVKRVWADGHLCSHQVSSSCQVFTTCDRSSVQSPTQCKGNPDTDPKAEQI